ncbi:hypothetical protein JVT61DRAFT_9021 [Boletus reticuloceps]|uniref:Uncharacterized protein n=1 Tax=Boletus reticuloceps TaxID=495285 RepID=A0A8I2YHR9_9AGAM|nr:hypothetical protein JVT61DRAFT_9021 [Boletus reticuloceps]
MLSDNLMDRRSIFSQVSNLAVFEPFISAIQQSLSHNGSSALSLPFITWPASCSLHHNSQAIHDWFELDKQIQSYLCAALIQTIGVPPRDFQVAILQYDHDVITGSARNLFLMDGMVALGNPKAKQSDQIIQGCIWQEHCAPWWCISLVFYSPHLNIFTTITTFAYSPIILWSAKDFNTAAVFTFGMGQR